MIKRFFFLTQMQKDIGTWWTLLEFESEITPVWTFGISCKCSLWTPWIPYKVALLAEVSCWGGAWRWHLCLVLAQAFFPDPPRCEWAFPLSNVSPLLKELLEYEAIPEHYKLWLLVVFCPLSFCLVFSHVDRKITWDWCACSPECCDVFMCKCTV